MNPVLLYTILLFLLPATFKVRLISEGTGNVVDTLPVGNKTLIREQQKSTDSFYHIYLTFDDGPAAGSRNINAAVASDSIPVNVFVVGEKVFLSDSLKVLFQLYRSNAFVETGNHSFSHANKHYHLYYKDPEQVVRDIELNTDTLQLQNKIVRLPGRNTWRVHGKRRTDLADGDIAADSLAAKGYLLFGWDLEWKYINDSSCMVQPATVLVSRIENMIRNKRSFTPRHIVILCHDPMFDDTVNQLQLKLFIKLIKEKPEYIFEQLSRYP